MGMSNDLTLPKDEPISDKWFLDNKDNILSDLKGNYEGTLDNCGTDDENTAEAKELYEKACADIISCKEDIGAYYAEAEYIENELKEFSRQSNVEKGVLRMEKLKIGQSFQVKDYSYENKVTVLKFNKEDLLLLWTTSGEPFVVASDYVIENNIISWMYSRYRADLDGALETYNELQKKGR